MNHPNSDSMQQSHVLLATGESMDVGTPLADFIVMDFSRANVEACRIGDAVDRLMSLSDSGENTRKFQRSMAFSFSGYDHDPREIYQIPAIRTFVAALNKEWRYWMHFLSLDTDCALLLYLLLLPPTVLGTTSGRTSVTVDPEQMHGLTDQLIASAMLLHQQHGYQSDESEAIILDWVSRLLPA